MILSVLYMIREIKLHEETIKRIEDVDRYWMRCGYLVFANSRMSDDLFHHYHTVIDKYFEGELNHKYCSVCEYTRSIRKLNSSYNRLNYFSNWLDRIQGIEKLDIRIDDINKIKEQKGSIKDIIRKLGIKRLYGHHVKVMWYIKGIRPPIISNIVVDEMKSMFNKIQEPFYIFSNGRSNLMNYQYIIYKFFQILGLNEFLDNISLPNVKSIIPYDEIWKDVCCHLGWGFISTY